MKPNPESANAERAKRAPFAIVFALAALLAMPLVAQAAHWPTFGGDQGRSGHQPIGAGEVPLLVNAKGAYTGKPQTSPIITDAPADVPPHTALGAIRRASNGGVFCEVNFFKLDDKGTRVGAATDVCADGDEDSFGQRPATNAADENTSTVRQGSVTPVSASLPDSFGMTYVLHNDRNAAARVVANGSPTTGPSQNDIAIAQFNEQTGARVTEIAVGSPTSPTNPTAGTTQGYHVDSSPVLTPPLNDAGDRALFFVARVDPDQTSSDSNPLPTQPRLFKVVLPAAHTASSLNTVPSISSVDVPGANAFASPTLAYLTDPTRGEQIPYVVVSGGGAGVDTIRTFEVSDLSPGPRVAAAPEITGTAFTASVPPLASGQIPGSTGTAPLQAPALYVPYDNGSDGTVVRKFVQEGENVILTPAATSDTLAGAPAPALAVHDLSPLSSSGRVVVTTGRNLYVLNGGNLSQTAAFRDVADGEALLDAGTTGFFRTTAAVARGLIYVARDNGNHLVLRLSDGERVCRAADVGVVEGCEEQEFAEHPDNNNSNFAIGQPALSRGLAVYLSNTGGSTSAGGAFSYKQRPANVNPTAAITATPNPAKQGETVTFDASGSTDEGEITKYEWDLDGNGTYETSTGESPQVTKAFPNAGTYTVGLRVTDDRSGTGTATITVTVQAPPPPPPANKPPTAAFTVTPNPAKVDVRVTFDASTSRDEDGSVTRYEWDLDGNGTFETNAGLNPRVQRSYRTAGVYNVKLKVTDNAGATTETVRQLAVTGVTTTPPRKSPRSLSIKVTPNRDVTVPFRFRTTGKLTRPSGVSRARGCSGRVTVTVKAGKKTISRRTTALRTNCTYRTTVRFRDRSRFGSARALRFVARYQGNKALRAKQSRVAKPRIG